MQLAYSSSSFRFLIYIVYVFDYTFSSNDFVLYSFQKFIFRNLFEKQHVILFKNKQLLLRMIIKTKIFFLLLLLLSSFSLSACIQGQTHQLETSGNVNLFFCNMINCSEFIVNTTNSSTSLVRCAFYELEDVSVVQHFTNQTNEDNLLLVVDKQVDTLPFQKGNITKRKTRGLMHNKFCSSDNWVLLGSFNPSLRATVGDYNNLILIHSSSLAHIFNEYHKNLFANTPHKDSFHTFTHNTFDGWVCFSPLGNCSSHLIQEINRATHSIEAALFTFTDKDVKDALVAASFRNVSITMVVESWQQKSLNQFFILQEECAPNQCLLRLENTSLLQHNKIFVFDNSSFITGSFNPTKAANTKNDETMFFYAHPRIASTYSLFINELFSHS